MLHSIPFLSLCHYCLNSPNQLLYFAHYRLLFFLWYTNKGFGSACGWPWFSFLTIFPLQKNLVLKVEFRKLLLYYCIVASSRDVFCHWISSYRTVSSPCSTILVPNTWYGCSLVEWPCNPTGNSDSTGCCQLKLRNMKNWWINFWPPLEAVTEKPLFLSPTTLHRSHRSRLPVLMQSCRHWTCQ